MIRFIRLFWKLHFIVKIALLLAIVGIFGEKFFDRMYAYALKIFQQICSKMANFSNKSAIRKRSISFFVVCLIFFSNSGHAAPKKYPCLIYRLSVPDMPSGDVAFVNGVNHKPERAIKCASLLSNLAGGYNVFVIYNPTNGLLGDLRKCFHELFRFKVSQPVYKLHEMWDYFFEHAAPRERLLQFCHSEGAIQVRNALIRYPDHLRKRIIVVAIAPGAYIDKEYCYKTYHYISRRDIVPHLDRQGFKRCRDRVCVLTPHKDAAFFDHHFLSPTYRPAIYHHLNQFVLSGGRECD